jgi:Ca2+-binding RTX toxin-like protein
MVAISYVNDALPEGGLNFNPAFAEVLDTTPAVVTYTGNTYEIANNNGGAFNGFKVTFHSYVNGGAGDFTYANVGGVLKPSGTITGMFLRAPDGTVIAQVTTGTNTVFGDAKLQNFFARLTNPAAETPKDAIFTALDGLFSNTNQYYGSPVADHITSYGNAMGDLSGEGGNDLLWSRDYASRKLIGGAGNDVMRVEEGAYEVHGGKADGTGATGQTDTVEVVGYIDESTNATLKKFTNIDVLRFVMADAPAPGSLETASMGARFELKDIGAANLPSNLAIVGSLAAYTENYISIYTGYDAAATKGVTLNLSGWTFKTWSEERNGVYIDTNSAAKALKDVVTGTSVADQISTYYGDDIIRGGGGADELNSGGGNDTFIYGKNEAAAGEYANGGYGPQGGTADKVLILGDNDFTGVYFIGIDQFVFGAAAKVTFDQGFAKGLGSSAEVTALAESPVIVGDAKVNSVVFQMNKDGSGNPSIDLSDVVFSSWTNGVDRISITGTKSIDTIAGSNKTDVINGGDGGDTLQGNAGADAFVFSASFGVDHITDFRRKEGDKIHLDDAVFTGLKLGVLKKKAFEIGEEADSRKDRIIYDKEDGIVRYDDDGTGKHKAVIVAVLDDAAVLKAGDILVI